MSLQGRSWDHPRVDLTPTWQGDSEWLRKVTGWLCLLPNCHPRHCEQAPCPRCVAQVMMCTHWAVLTINELVMLQSIRDVQARSGCSGAISTSGAILGPAPVQGTVRTCGLGILQEDKNTPSPICL